MFNYTPDISNHEQMTEIIYNVNTSNRVPEVVVSFLDFFFVSDKTGQGFF